MDATIVKTISKDELPALRLLYEDHLFDDPEKPCPDEIVVQTVWNNLMSNPAVHLFAAEVDRRLVGSALLVIIPNLTRGCRPFGLIENVVTHRDFRRRGIATVLLSEVLAFAWRADCYKVMLLSSVRRNSAHRLYEKLGFNRQEKIGFVAHAPGSQP